MTDGELEQAKGEIHDLFEDVRRDLAEDLGDDSDDYRADRVATNGRE